MKSSKFVMHYYVLVFSLLLLAMPFYHQATGSGMRPVLNINLDSIAVIAGLVGFGTFVAITVLNRRLAALEKSMEAKNHERRARVKSRRRLRMLPALRCSDLDFQTAFPRRLPLQSVPDTIARFS
jgi:hypothetical protein